MIGIVYTGFSGANVFGVPIGTVIGDWVGWRFTFLFIIVVSVFVGILMLIYLPKEDELSHLIKHFVQLVLNHKLAQAS